MEVLAQQALIEKKERLRLFHLKRLITYVGPDPEQQSLALITLNDVLGYYTHGPHKQIILHQNETAFGDRPADLVLGFRGLGKSTGGTIARCIKYLVDDPNVRILIVSDTQDAAERFLKEIRNHLRHNEDLIAMFGPFLGAAPGTDLGRYRDSYLTIRQRTDASISEPTILCLGTGGQAASRHFDVIVLDDLVTIRNSRTQVQKKNVQDWHGSTLLGCCLPHTKVHYLGTRYYPHDLYQELEDGRQDQERGVLHGCVLKIPAIVYDDGNARSNYPEKYTLAKFYEMRARMGRYHFQSQMQQDTSAGEGEYFNYNDFRWYGGSEPDRPPLDELAIFQFSDLAALRTDTGAFYAGVTVGVTQGKELAQRKVYMLDIVHQRGGTKKQRELILKQIDQWNPVQHGIEAVAMQAGFAQEVGEHYDRRAVPCKCESDKEFRARRVSPVFEGNRVYFPYPNTPLGRKFAVVVDELCAFPESQFKDCVDAVVGVITLALYGGPPAASGALDDDDLGWSDGDGLKGNY